MKYSIFQSLGRQLKLARTTRGMTQPDLARRLGRDRARISELERDLLNERFGRDRLTLLAEICDALHLVPILVPENDAAAHLARIGAPPVASAGSGETPSTFDEVFVDLSGEEGD